jgi:hypothetical protein
VPLQKSSAGTKKKNPLHDLAKLKKLPAKIQKKENKTLKREGIKVIHKVTQLIRRREQPASAHNRASNV